jgi:hypothetical protein
MTPGRHDLSNALENTDVQEAGVRNDITCQPVRNALDGDNNGALVFAEVLETKSSQLMQVIGCCVIFLVTLYVTTIAKGRR